MRPAAARCVLLDGQRRADAHRFDAKREDTAAVTFKPAVRVGAGRKRGPAQREHGRPTAGNDVAGLRPILADQLGGDNGATHCRTQ